MRWIPIVLIVGLFSCKKDAPEPIVIPNEEEVITTLNYTLTATNGDVVTFTFRDLDGDGGTEPVITNGALDTNTTYSGVLELLNETESPAENITEEVEEEGAEHQFFFSESLADLNIEYGDTDSDGNPIGIKTTLKTGKAGKTDLTITLRHQPNKSGAAVAGGDITNAGGETDISVVFSVDVK